MTRDKKEAFDKSAPLCYAGAKGWEDHPLPGKNTAPVRPGRSMKEEIPMSKTLVAYFSATGTTARAAERLAKAIGADLHEIRPKVPYTKKDLDWTDTHSRSTLEMKDKTSRPEIEGRVENMDQYDTIYVGFPIWWYVAPTIINTFLEAYDFSGKTVIPFATSGGSGMGKTLEGLKKSCNGKLVPGRMLNSSAAIEELRHLVEA